MRWTALILTIFLSGCGSDEKALFHVLDTDFSKGRLTHEQTVTLSDLEKFHGHLCDGLVVGALAMQQAMEALSPGKVIDRTNFRIVSKPPPCLTDVAVYLTGGRYQFSTFYVDTSFDGIFIIQRIDDGKAVSVSLNKGVKPAAIDSLGMLAAQQKLSACGIDSLKLLEDDFAKMLMNEKKPADLFTVKPLDNFLWQPNGKYDFVKTDILNKYAQRCMN